jgi:membrane peptidoglycan carboxypeptidase
MTSRLRSPGGLFGLLGGFVATAAVMGVVTAGLFMPMVGAVGSVARAGVDTYDSLPTEFRQTTPYQQSRILAADGKVIATPFDQNRIIVPLKAVAPIMRVAQVAIEDSRFYEHAGFDAKGTFRGLIAPLLGEQVRGGSSITQQFVKMTLTDQANQVGDKAAADEATSRTLMRKLQELKYATQVEKAMSKDEILSGYLNLAYYGDGAYGVEAASRHYFNHPSATLTLSEAALLAGLVQNPSATDPVGFPEASMERRDIVLARMLELGLITSKDYAAAKAVTLKTMLKVQPDRGSCANAPTPNYAYFCDYVIAWLKEQPALGKTVAERIKRINTGGLTIQTTLDPTIMARAKAAVDARVPVANKASIGAAAVVVEPSTGKVLAMAQNTTYSLEKAPGNTTINFAVDKKYGGSIGFSLGSTMKALALVTALEKGWAVRSSVYTEAAGPGRGIKPALQSSDFGDACGQIGYPGWSPENDESVRAGNMTLATATARSINTAFVALAERIGPCNIHATEGRLGMHTGQGNPITKGPSAIILGSDSVSPLTVASVYGVLANDGKRCEPHPVIAITGPDGKPVNLQLPPCQQVVEPDIARGVTYLLRGPLRSGGTASRSGLAGGREAAGKTGTAEGRTEAWFVGYTPQLSTAVWVGTPWDGLTSLRGKYLPSIGYVSGWGSELSAPIWKKIMDGTLAGQPFRNFPDPSDRVMNGVTVAVPSVTGLTVNEAKARLEAAGFATGAVIEKPSNAPKGTVIGTDPAYRAPKGTAVAVIVSNGTAPKPTTTTTKPGGKPTGTVKPPRRR